MKALSLSSRKIEGLFYVLIWVLVFSVPYFSERGSGHPNWNNMLGHWVNLTGFLIIFMANVYILVPRLLLKKRYLYYFFFGFCINNHRDSDQYDRPFSIFFIC